MTFNLGYRCSHLQSCDNPLCQHKQLHLVKHQLVVAGNFLTCASHPGYCRFVKDFVKCELIKKEAVKV